MFDFFKFQTILNWIIEKLSQFSQGKNQGWTWRSRIVSGFKMGGSIRYFAEGGKSPALRDFYVFKLLLEKNFSGKINKKYIPAPPSRTYLFVTKTMAVG